MEEGNHIAWAMTNQADDLTNEGKLQTLQGMLIGKRVRVFPWEGDSAYTKPLPPGRIVASPFVRAEGIGQAFIVELDSLVSVRLGLLRSFGNVRYVLTSISGSDEEIELFAQGKDISAEERRKESPEFQNIESRYWLRCRFLLLREGKSWQEALRDWKPLSSWYWTGYANIVPME